MEQDLHHAVPAATLARECSAARFVQLFWRKRKKRLASSLHLLPGDSIGSKPWEYLPSVGTWLSTPLSYTCGPADHNTQHAVGDLLADMCDITVFTANSNQGNVIETTGARQIVGDCPSDNMEDESDYDADWLDIVCFSQVLVFIEGP